MSGTPKLETITIVYDLPAALCLRSALESLGIAVFVDGLHHAGVDWWITVALGGMRVRVVDRDAQTARAYLQSVAPQLAAQPLVSTDIWRKPMVNGLLLAFGLFAGGLLWVRSRPGARNGLNASAQDPPDAPPQATTG